MHNVVEADIPDEPFSSRLASAVLKEASAHTGIDATDARLMRLGENALFHLPHSSVVVRIARSREHWDDAVKEVAVSNWLKESGLPAARLYKVDQPISISGYPATFWRYIDGRNGGRGDVGALGHLLLELHRTSRPTAFELPEQDILTRVEPRIESASVPDADKRFLLNRVDELRDEISELAFPLEPTATHGDAHVQNLMISDGSAVLIDFERFAWGQPEWDLAMTATEYLSAGWWTAEEYRAFCDAYRYDVTQWDGFNVLQKTHEIKMTTWIMQNVDESEEIDAEYATRIETMRTGRATEPWRPF
ncbi:aminoglycoside phosphotransferase family protein [Lentzea sp. NPDC102401]|uniref:aminoglycoside phosphotransferase family protein n=1 Tax=Lentzea sp. NPDC102401 TaxID=3364128 RepID=UPI00381FB8E1